jgi:hypothetical protein
LEDPDLVYLGGSIPGSRKTFLVPLNFDPFPETRYRIPAGDYELQVSPTVPDQMWTLVLDGLSGTRELSPKNLIKRPVAVIRKGRGPLYTDGGAGVLRGTGFQAVLTWLRPKPHVGIKGDVCFYRGDAPGGSQLAPLCSHRTLLGVDFGDRTASRGFTDLDSESRAIRFYQTSRVYEDGVRPGRYTYVSGIESITAERIESLAVWWSF